VDIPSVAFTLHESWTVAPKFGSLAAMRAKRNPSFVTLEETRRLINSDLAVAETRARQALDAHPGEPQALALLGETLQRRRQFEAARLILEPLLKAQPQLGSAWRALGISLARLGERDGAIGALTRAIDLSWRDTDSWYELGDLLTFAEPEPGASLNDAFALKLRADAILHTDRWTEFEPLLEQCVALAPGYAAARFRLATMLFTHGKCGLALPHIERLLESDPANVLCRALKALALMWSIQFDRAIAEFGSFIESCPHLPGLWLEYARLLHAAGDPGATAAYKRVIRLLPGYVDAYLALAHARGCSIDDEVMACIQAQFSRPGLAIEERAKLHFVLGRAMEQGGNYRSAFAQFQSCNDILFDAREYGIDSSNDYVARASTMFRPGFFRARAEFGCRDIGAIFIVGLPRSGSTLIEQILGSHPSIEALGEIDCLPEIIQKLAPERPGEPNGLYPFNLGGIDAARFRLIGEAYVAAARGRCRRATPFFTDKLPGNYAHVGLIQLTLPGAKIIDVRRHPLGCCFSYFEHYFQAGHPLRLRLRDAGRNYANYVETMALFDEQLPARVHRVIYERLIENLEREVRRMLAYLGLPFSESCLRFHESGRYVSTLSADQVKKPLYDTAVEHWRYYEQWLGPLKEELGPVLEFYPDAPRFFPHVQARSKRPLRLGIATNPFGSVRGLRQPTFGNARAQNRRFL
jgi:tetratricopeptide (TPR) repeat protein